MSISALDSRLFRNIFGTASIRAVFSDAAYTSYMIETECALARAQSAVGAIPSTVGDAVTTALAPGVVVIDYDRLSRETDVVGYPVLPLVRQLVEQTTMTTTTTTTAAGEAAKYIHWGATTQDIMDTASVLQLRAGLAMVARQLDDLAATLARLAERYKDTPMAGRTHLQHALPVTFGYKCAVYLSAVQRHVQRLKELQGRCLLVQFGGAAGTLASLGDGDVGLRVRERLAAELGLGNPPITWHVVRDNIAEVLNFLALVGGSLGKIALDVMIMSSNELGEVAEPFVPHRGASSTMPQKRNPISSEVVLAISKLLRANAGLGLDAMVADFERASGPWHLEWVAVPEAFVLAVGALHQTQFALSGLVVNTEAMMDNLCSTKGLIVGEAVMMGLAPAVGRQEAHDIVYDACRESIETGMTLLEALKKRPEVMERVDEARLANLCDPKNYLGASRLMVEDVLKLADSRA